MKTKRAEKKIEMSTTSHSSYADLTILSVSVLGFLANFEGEFVFDDAESIVHNPVVTGRVSLAEVIGSRKQLLNIHFRAKEEKVGTRDFWGTPMSSPHSHKSYRPLTTLTFWLNHRVHGLSSTGYHVVNIFLHAAVSSLLHRVVLRITSRSCSFLTALIFAVHPIHCEAVSNITGRAELLMAFFFLIGLKFYFENKSSLLVVGFSILSVLSKEQGIMLMPILCTYEFFGVIRNRKQRDIRMILTFSTTTVGLLIWRLWMNNFDGPHFTESDNAAAFLEDPLFKYINYSYLWLYNVFLLINPSSLCFDYSMGCIPLIQSITDIRILAPLILLAIIIGLMVAVGHFGEQQKRATLIGTILGGMAFLPSSNLFFTVGFTIAERVLYVPSIGFCLVAAVCLEFSGRKHYNKELIIGIITFAAIAQSHQRSLEWRSELSLFKSGLGVCPNNAKIHYNLGKVLSDSGDLENAEVEYQIAISLNPHYANAMNNLGNIREQQGKYLEAEELLERAIRLRPKFATAWMNLGIARMHLNKFDDSYNSFSESLKIRPLSAECFYNLGNLFHKINSTDMALEAWRNATSLDPTLAFAWVNHFVLLDELDRCDEVVSLSHSAISHSSHPALHFQIGSCMGRIGMFEEAEYHLRKALEMKPTIPLYHANLGVLYQRWRRYSDAESAYLKALSLDPSAEGIQENLQSVRSKMRHKTMTLRV